MNSELRRLYDSYGFDPSAAVDSYWRATAAPMRHSTPMLSGSERCDVAVIGGGYTDLWAALRLARDYGMDVRVLDAVEPAWGASGRNGGFCSVGASKLSYAKMTARFGREEARAFHLRQIDAIEQVRSFIESARVDAMVHSDAEVCLAHSEKHVSALEAEARHRTEEFGSENEFLTRAELRSRGIAGPEFFAGRITRWGFALHPLRYGRALADAAVDAGVKLHSNSEVTGWRQDCEFHVLSTSRGDLRANKVLVATNGYSSETIPAWMAGRYLPAVSAVLVTRPLTKAECLAQGWTTDLRAYNTRRLLHYFRLMPDGRFLFGGRGFADASRRGQSATRLRLQRDFCRLFPAWSDVSVDFFWCGFVCMTYDLVPYAGPIPGMQNAWACYGYHGVGVAMASWSGARSAGLIAGDLEDTRQIPAVMRTPPRKFPLPKLRIPYLRAMSIKYALEDQLL